MRKLLLSIALICLLLLLACNSKTSESRLSESAKSPQHDDFDESKYSGKLLSDEEQRRFEDPDTPHEEKQILVKKYEAALEKMLDEVKAAYDEVKNSHPDLDMSEYGISEEDMANDMLENDELSELDQNDL